jgi:hypothetical protein
MAKRAVSKSGGKKGVRGRVGGKAGGDAHPTGEESGGKAGGDARPTNARPTGEESGDWIGNRIAAAVKQERDRCVGIAADAWERIRHAVDQDSDAVLAISIADRAYWDIYKGMPWPPAPPAAPPRKRPGRDQRNWS